MQLHINNLKGYSLKIGKPLLLLGNIISAVTCLTVILFTVYFLGFEIHRKEDFYKLYKLCLFIFALVNGIRFIFHPKRFIANISRLEWGAVFILYSVFLAEFLIPRNTLEHLLTPSGNLILLMATCCMVAVIEISKIAIRLVSKLVNPMVIFTGSFLLIIAVGSFLLTMPNSTFGGIKLVDAVFISTSATCITGLASVPFPETFTLTGQWIVLGLIQIGGIGVVTITTFFALSFMEGTSYRNTVKIRDLISSDSNGKIGPLLWQIILVTFSIELVGALGIYFSLGTLSMPMGTKIYFSIFHSVSAFCNAGFSTFPQGLANPQLIPLNSFYLIISFLIIFGGIGYPIFSNLLRIIAHQLSQIPRILRRKPTVRYIHEWKLNSIVVFKATFFLLLGGTLYFALFEWNGMLEIFPKENRLAQAFFNAVTPRTAGFNSTDLSVLHPLTLFAFLLLMWIGAAPQSTGGGIKVTTFWVILKGAVCAVRGIGRLEIHQRELSYQSVIRAIATAAISITLILTTYVLMIIFEKGIGPQKLLFEIVSAISTVGLSMGATMELSDNGKIVLILLMFIGRVGVITFFASFLRQQNRIYHRYPQGSVLIN